MSTHSVIKENLLAATHGVKCYRPYETQSRENVLFRIFPDFVFRLRWVFLSFLHKKLFRFWHTDITLGAFFFLILIASTIPLAEYLISKDPETKGSYTGRLTFLNLCLVFSFASRNSIWALIIGLSYERAIMWHKLFASTLIACGFIHGLTNSWVSNKGLFLFINICAIVFFSLWYLRNRLFYYFYVLHLLLICALFYNAYQHNPQKNLIACSFWLVDLAIRMLFQIYFFFKGVRFSLRLSPKKRFIELKAERHIINHRPGQFFFLLVPRLSLLEPHTFSAATVSEEDNLIFYIRALGDWTGEMAKIAQVQNQIVVLLNGPYGIPTVDIESTTAKHFLLIAGGIGITFIRPYAHWLADQSRRGRKIKSLRVLWALRESELADFVHFSDLLIELALKNKTKGSTSSQNEVLDFDFQIFLKSDIESFESLKTPLKKCVRREALDLDQFFKIYAESVPEKKSKSVKVLCCGPEKMARHCFKLAKGLGYDIHNEYFEF